MSALAGGVFAATDAQDEDAQLRQLVEDLGRRSYDARLGHRCVPDPFDAELWRNLEATGLIRLTSTPDMEAGPHELAVALYGVARHAGAVPLAETDALAGWLGQQAGIELPGGPLTVAVADAETDGARVAGTAHAVPWTRACTTVLAVRGRDGLRVGVLDGGGHRQFRSSAGSFDFSGHAGQRLLPRLEGAERATELDALAGVFHRQGCGGIQHPDGLHAA